jgi:hypothetical protein
MLNLRPAPAYRKLFTNSAPRANDSGLASGSRLLTIYQGPYLPNPAAFSRLHLELSLKSALASRRPPSVPGSQAAFRETSCGCRK